MKNNATSVFSGAIGALVLNALLFGILFQFPAQSKLVIERLSPPLPAAEAPISTNNGVVSVVKSANPAVVSVIITKDVPILEQVNNQQANPFGGLFGNLPFQFFNRPQYRQKGTEKKEVGGGSGFVVSSDGYIVTNHHVIQDTTAEYTVFMNDGKKYPASVVASDETIDVALLKIEAKDLPFLAFGDSDKLELGQSVIAIGNALAEFRNTVSVGVVSGLLRSIRAGDGTGKSEKLDGVIQTDAAINPGNSGGPLLDLSGNVIGVNVAVANGVENIAFALPANVVKSAVESIKKNGRVVRPFLGIRYVPVTKALQEANRLSVDYGVLVSRGEKSEDLAVIPGSPADKADIVKNDIILKLDDQKIDDEHSLAMLIQKKSVGDKIRLRVLHKGIEKDVFVTLEERPQTIK